MGHVQARRYERACVEFLNALAAARASLCENWHTVESIDGPLRWTVFTHKQRTLPSQGWKIHVSSSVADSPRLFDCVVPFLIRNNCCFKIPSSMEDVLRVNSGRAGAALIGKVVTVYPDDSGCAGQLASGLSQVWHCPRAPRILTDLQVQPGSPVFLRFGSFTSSDNVKDAFGRIYSALRRPDGILVPDERRLDGRQPAWAIPPLPNAAPPEALGSARRELDVLGKRYFLLARLQSAPKGDVLLAIDEEFQTFVIKLARRGAAEDANGHDGCDRLKREAMFLTFLMENGFKSPRVRAVTDEAIVLDDINGLTLDLVPGEEIGEPFRKLVTAIADLHDLGVAHHDIKLSNAILAGSEVCLIDFEFARFLGTAAAPIGGARGFAAPQCEDAPALLAYDVYLLGACLAHAALGVNPATLAPGTGRLLSLLKSIGQRQISEIVEWAMNPKPELRPSARALLERLTQLPVRWSRSLEHLAHTCQTKPEKGTNRRNRKIAETAMRSSVSAIDSQRDEVCWDRGDVGISRNTISSGIAGQIMGLATVKYATGRDDFDKYILIAAEHLAHTDRTGPAFGLFTGQAGMAFALALVGEKYSRNNFSAEGRRRFALASANVVEPDLFSGAAGIVWAACLLSSVLKTAWPIEMAKPAACRLIETAREHERLLVWTLSGALMEDTYLGAAHGAAGVAMALGVWARYTGCRRSRELSYETFMRLYQYGRTSDQLELRYQLNSLVKAPAGTWCHGSMGYLWSMLHAFGDDESLKEAIDWAFRAFEKSFLVSEPGYCHGMAGQLDLWSLLGRYSRFSGVAKTRARLAAQLLEQLGSRDDMSWTWTADVFGRIRPDLWTGTLGPACALALFQRGRGDLLFCPDTLTAMFRPGR